MPLSRSKEGGIMARAARRTVKKKVQKWTGYHRILWPTDFSPLAKAALPHAMGLAAEGEGELVLLHVLPSPAAYAVPDVSGAVWIPLQRKTRAAAQTQLRRLETLVKRSNVRVHAAMVEGVPFLQILRAAKRLRCDLIVLATHGRTGLMHAIMGSVAENVIRRAHCPVLTVRPQRFRRGV
jgi:nucleotide-binding universal stress UspA family protein